jgi:hypothetical protein
MLVRSLVWMEGKKGEARRGQLILWRAVGVTES